MIALAALYMIIGTLVGIAGTFLDSAESGDFVWHQWAVLFILSVVLWPLLLVDYVRRWSMK